MANFDLITPMSNIIYLAKFPVRQCYRGWKILLWEFLLPIKAHILSSLWRIKCGKNVRFMGRTIIRTYDKEAISIGNDVVFNSCDNRNLVGLTGPTILCACKGARIEIGSQTGFSSVVINSRSRIEIGNNVNVGGNTRIFDHDFHPLEWRARRHPEQGEKTRVKPVVIEDDVFIGTNAIILKGTHIGARSIVAAGSVVFGLDVPHDSLVKGNPAVVVKQMKNHG